MAVLSANEIFFTAFEPKQANRFILYIDGVPSYIIKGVNAVTVTQGEVKQMPNSIGIYFKMLPYGNFQDKGVNGTQINHGAPYSFKSKGGVKGLKGMPPPSKLDSWMVRKGIAPRNAGGQFTSRKGLQFLIARGIFKKGIKPSLFFTKPFEDAFRTLPDDLVEKYGLDMEQDLCIWCWRAVQHHYFWCGCYKC